MDEKVIDNLMSEIIENSRFNQISQEQKEILKYKLFEKFISVIYLTALDLLEDSKKEEFSKLLATKNNKDISTYIDNNIQNYPNLMEKAINKFSEEVEDYF